MAGYWDGLPLIAMGKREDIGSPYFNSSFAECVDYFVENGKINAADAAVGAWLYPKFNNSYDAQAAYDLHIKTIKKGK
jgi:hypothetical protein